MYIYCLRFYIRHVHSLNMCTTWHQEYHNIHATYTVICEASQTQKRVLSVYHTYYNVLSVVLALRYYRVLFSIFANNGVTNSGVISVFARLGQIHQFTG